MKTKLTRMISLMLTLVMCFSMLNVTAFAAEDDRFNCDCETRHTHSEECWEKHVICGIEEGAVVCGDEEHEHTESCYHAHAAECYEDVLICEESVYHVHVKSCFTNQSGWTGLKCEYANMETHTHEYTCLTQAGKAAIIEAYSLPDKTFEVKEHHEPYIFSAMQTYLNPGYYYRNPNDGDSSNPKMMLMGNVQGMNQGDMWQWDGGKDKRFVPGVESNFVVAYCCDQVTGVTRYMMHRQINLEDAGYYDDDTAKMIRSVMMNGYPALSLEEIQKNLAKTGFAYEDYALLDEADVIAGTQIAIWHLANANTISQMHYWYTKPNQYTPLTAHWKNGDPQCYQPEAAARMEKFADYLLDLANEAPMEAPESQIVVSQVEVANLIMTPDGNGTYTVDLQVMLNGEYDNSHDDTNITITATAGEATASVTADGSSVYTLKLEGYNEGDDITVTMSGTQYLPLGVYFYEPYTTEGQDVRKVSQNMIGLNAGTIPVGDTVTLPGNELASTGLVLKKVNETGKILANAEFNLLYVDKENITTTLGTYVTDENGEVAVEGLMAGKTYYLTEAKAPAGYDPIGGTVKLEVGEDGQTIVFNLPDGVTCDSEADENYILTVVNCKTPYDLTVEKVLRGGATNAADEFTIVVTLDDTSINGIYGDMTFENGVATVTLKGGESKTATDLPSGTGYTVTETDSKGYDVSYNGCTGVLNADHVATVTNSKNMHTLGSITVNKTTTGAATPADATFQLQKMEGEEWINVGEPVKFSAFVENAYTFSNLVEGTYRVIESGAEIEEFHLETTYGENVVLTKSIAENGDTAVNSGSILVTNTYDPYVHTLGSILVTKNTSGAATPADATFQLQKMEGNEWINVGEPVAYSAFVENAYTFTELEEGTYRVVETGAEVDGYTLETTYSDNVVLNKTTANNGDTSVNSGEFSVTNTYEPKETEPEETEPEDNIEIPDEDVPLASTPVEEEKEEEDDLIEIPDEDVPMADVPKTGDLILPFLGMAIASGAATIFAGKTDKKKEDEE